MLSKYGNCTRLLKTKNKLKIQSVVFRNEVGKNSPYFVGVFNKMIIPLVLVGSGYEMILTNSALRASFAIYNLIPNAHAWNNRLWMMMMSFTVEPHTFVQRAKGLANRHVHYIYYMFATMNFVISTFRYFASTGVKI